MASEIDFVILWVDGEDNSWVKQYNHYKKIISPLDSGFDPSRYRDMGILKFFFRAIERYAPWVNKIHFVTCGQKPSWLKNAHPKLSLINHQDFIPDEVLPTFNSTSIEMFLHKIPGISEKFVYFNDDMIINRPVSENFFFRDGLPCDTLSLYPNIENDISSYPYGAMMHTVLTLINKHYSPRKTAFNHPFKFLNAKYGLKGNVSNLLSVPWAGFTGFKLTHSAQPYLKKTFNTVWDRESELLRKSSLSKFREPFNISQYLFAFSQLASGEFYPVTPVNRSAFYNLSTSNLSEAIENIISEKDTILCLNDSEKMDDFEAVMSTVISSFEDKFPVKSSFEI